jgi:nucleotide-binding universal stress UspA family protein
MFQIKKILFPVDFSEACLGASRYVEAFTGRFQAELTLLHVVDNSAYRAWGTSVYWGMSGSDVGQEGVKWAREDREPPTAWSIDELAAILHAVNAAPRVKGWSSAHWIALPAGRP